MRSLLKQTHALVIIMQLVKLEDATKLELVIYVVPGYYCVVNSTDYSDKPCPSGHYCPENTTQADLNPCSVGTFNPDENQVDINACQDCTGGRYCASTGLSAPTGNCT